MRLDLSKDAAKIRNRALKRGAQSAVAAASKEIRLYYRIKKSDLDKHIKRVINKTGMVHLYISAEGIALSKFRHTQTERGVTAYVAKGDTRKLESGFKATFRGARRDGSQYEHSAVVKRMTSKRFPLREYFGPSAKAMWTSEKRLDTMQTAMQEMYVKTLTHELNRRQVIK